MQNYQCHIQISPIRDKLVPLRHLQSILHCFCDQDSLFTHCYMYYSQFSLQKEIFGAALHLRNCCITKKTPIFYSSPLPFSSLSHTALSSLPPLFVSPTLVSSSVSRTPLPPSLPPSPSRRCRQAQAVQ